jgi:outer membrane protein OmpA-like peptidoglycan-associated protein/WD40 repeat protein
MKRVRWRLTLGVTVALACAAGASLGLASDSPTVTSDGPLADSGFAGVPFGIGFSPDGGLLATSTLDASLGTHLAIFQVGSGGSLSAVGGGANLGNIEPGTTMFSPAGGLVAVAGYDRGTADGSVTMFTVSSSGIPGPATAYATGDTAASATYSLAFSPDGRFLATADGGDNTVTVFSVGSGGALSPVSGSPVSTGSGSTYAPYGVSYSANGQELAVTLPGDDAVELFSVASNGVLTSAGSPVSTGSDPPYAVAFSPFGNWLATADSDSVVSMFSVGSGGALTLVPGPFASSPYSNSVAFSPDGGLLVTAGPTVSGSSSILVDSVGSSGSLTPISGSPFTTGSDIDGNPVAFSPGGGFIAAAVSTGNGAESLVRMFTVSPAAAAPPPSTSTTTTTTPVTTTPVSTPPTTAPPKTVGPVTPVTSAPKPPPGGTPAPPGATLPDALVKVKPPVAEASARSASGSAALAYTLSSAGSKAAAKHHLTSYVWRLGGRIISHKADPVYKFPKPNESYSVGLKVTQNGGETGSATVTVHPREVLVKTKPKVKGKTKVKTKPTQTHTVISTTTTSLTLSSDTLFAFNSFVLTATAKSELSSARKPILASPAVKISGYCDNTGDNDPVSEGNTYNDWLSKMRALAVADYLYGDHVPKQAKLLGYGRTDFVATNATASGRAENRRVVISYETVTEHTVK